MLLGIVLAVFGGLLTFGISYDFFVRKSFRKSKSNGLGNEIPNHHIDNGVVDSAAHQMSSQSTGV